MNQTEMAAHDKTTWAMLMDANHAGAKVMQAQASIASYYRSANSDKFWEQRSVSSWNIESMEARLVELQDACQALSDKLDAHEANYTGWTRFWGVPSGHIHSSRNCSTCNKMGKSTEFYLVHEVSGMDEKAAVDFAGPALCTVCFPSAPLGWTDGLFDPNRAEKATRKAELDAKRSAAAEATVVDPTTGKVLFKTVRGATNFIAGELSSLTWYGPGHPSATRWIKDINNTLDALKAKGAIADDDSYYTEALARARKKTIKEGGQSKF